MSNDFVFKLSYDARIAAFFDPECLQRGGYILKKFSDGYRYYPLGSHQAHAVKNSKVVELGQHISTFYWSRQSPARNKSNCRIISFK